MCWSEQPETSETPHQGVSAEPSSTHQPPAVLHPACHVRRFLHSTALQPDHRMCSGSGVMRTGLLVQTRQGWRPRPPRTHGKCKYVSQQTADWRWLFSDTMATIQNTYSCLYMYVYVLTYCTQKRTLINSPPCVSDTTTVLLYNNIQLLNAAPINISILYIK